MLKNCVKFLVLSLAMMVSGCASMTSVRHSESYDTTLQRQKEMVILPANVEVSTFDVSSKQTRMYDYEMHLEDVIKTALTTELGTHGFRTKSLNRRQIHEQHLEESVGRVRSAYNAARDELYADGPMMDKKKASSIINNIGPAAIELGEKTNSDVILLVDYVGSIKTNGSRTRDFVVSLLINNSALLHDADNARIVVGIIDAKTGQLLWTNWSTHSEDLYSYMLSNASSHEKLENKKLQIIIKQLVAPWKEKK